MESENPAPCVMNLREALAADIPVLAAHHRKMFEEMEEKKGTPLSAAKAEAIEKAYTLKLKSELAYGICKAWLMEDAGDVIAGGAITMVSFVPNPSDLSSRVAYLHSVYTHFAHRNRGCARRIVERAMGFCRGSGMNRMILAASEAGRPLYEKIGFRSTPNLMILLMEG